MSDTAFQTQYRQEFIAGFEQSQSLLRDSVTTETQIKGNEAVFLVADSGDAEAVTRGVNGLIPGRADNLEQLTCTLKEWHDVPEKTGFNLFASQGDGRRIMQETSMKVINRKIDQDIIAQLATATNDTGNGQVATLDLALDAITILGNNEVEMDGLWTAVVTPSFMGQLHKVKEFNNAEFVERKPLVDGSAMYSGKVGYYNWLGVKWIVHSRLPGRGTSAAKCFLYHRNAIGHAVNTGGIQTFADYDKRHDKSWCRTSIYMGSKLLQNSGVVVMIHDDTQLGVAQ